MGNLAETLAKVGGFRKLPVGWDYGSDGPASGLAVITCSAIGHMLADAGVSNFDAAPGKNGAVTLVGIKGDKEVELSCRPNGRYNITFFNGEDCIAHDGKTFIQSVEILRGEDWLPEISSTSCILSGTYLLLGDSRQRLSKTLAMAPVYRYCVSSASQTAESPFAITSANIVRSKSRAIRQSFGELEEGLYQPLPC